MNVNSKILLIILLGFITLEMNAQTLKRIKPKEKWFLGVESGLNTITSLNPNQTNFTQCGILIQYYFNEELSVSGRLKYFETGVSYLGKFSRGYFEGTVISLPIDINFEWEIFKKFNGTAQLGIAVNKEVKTNYYPDYDKFNYSTFYGSFNPGFGFNYFLTKKMQFISIMKFIF